MYFCVLTYVASVCDVLLCRDSLTTSKSYELLEIDLVYISVATV